MCGVMGDIIRREAGRGFSTKKEANYSPFHTASMVTFDTVSDNDKRAFTA